MSDAMTRGQEKTQLFKDLYDGKIPKRVPIGARLSLEFAIQYAGLDLMETQWNSQIEEALDKICQDFTFDLFPVNALRYPSFYQILGSRNFIMGSGGFLQHPDVEGLEQDEYDEFIASPFDCIVEKVLPRLYTALDTDPNNKAMTLAKAFKAHADEFGNFRAVSAKLSQKYGFAELPGMPGMTEAPFDFLADLLRGFRGASTDIRRIPDKVEAAVEALIPILIKTGLPPVRTKYSATFIPLHMAPYMRPKDFERFYWPSFKKVVDALAEAGQSAFIFAEHDWMRYLDYLYELPENTRIMFEFGDPKLAKEKLGKKHILTGFYPVTLLKTGTKQECVDKAKEIIDVMAPGGKYYFAFDKTPITLDSVNVENLQAVLDYVATQTNY